jgi:hypothetical protein
LEIDALSRKFLQRADSPECIHPCLLRFEPIMGSKMILVLILIPEFEQLSKHVREYSPN